MTTSAMVDPKWFSKEWILSLRSMYPKADPLLLEKTIHAFELLSLLMKTKETFSFKGGTALMLHVPEITRLSIDIDVIGKFSDELLEKAIQNSVFTHFKPDIRTGSIIPKKHYQFFFQSCIMEKEDNILLDVLEAENPYTRVVRKRIDLPIFKLSQPQDVSLPASEELLGDKMTAFAPNSLGIPYNKNKSMDIIKQLFDIATLFDIVKDFTFIQRANQRVFKIQNTFFSNQYHIDEVLNDTIQTSYLICQLDLKNSIENEKTEELRRGMRQIGSYLLNARFTLREIKIAASKAALLASALKSSNKLNPLPMRFDDTKITNMSEMQLDKTYEVLARLRFNLPEAFYYWHLIS